MIQNKEEFLLKLQKCYKIYNDINSNSINLDAVAISLIFQNKSNLNIFNNYNRNNYIKLKLNLLMDRNKILE